MSDRGQLISDIQETAREFERVASGPLSRVAYSLRQLTDELSDTSAPQIIHTVAELEALDPDTIVQRLPQYPGRYSLPETAGDLAYVVRRWGTNQHLPAVVVAPAEQVRAARKALEEA